MTLQWERENRLNISVLDAQHKQLISCLNELEQAMKNGITSKDIEEILLRTEQYTTRHFGLEEKYMTESNFPGLKTMLPALIWNSVYISRNSEKKWRIPPAIQEPGNHTSQPDEANAVEIRSLFFENSL